LKWSLIFASAAVVSASCGGVEEGSASTEPQQGTRTAAVESRLFWGDPHLIDLGVIPSGELREFSVSVGTRSPYAERVVGIKASCGCLDVVAHSEFVSPGELAEIRFELKASGAGPRPFDVFFDVLTVGESGAGRLRGRVIGEVGPQPSAWAVNPFISVVETPSEEHRAAFELDLETMGMDRIEDRNRVTVAIHGMDPLVAARLHPSFSETYTSSNRYVAEFEVAEELWFRLLGGPVAGQILVDQRKVSGSGIELRQRRGSN
jgi:hypothetical protein